ncbi:hypothetical protein [Oceanobacillus salinisoli]|uniref:hypothetical protein n=1 Tax=Oceanobacillus salinisoli TaxID=2678611 RepID=UPI0012E17F75|nr:hypothetical protein [Oceanobacillus salinisoli]
MGLIFEKQWHKMVVLLISLYFSLIFTTVFLPWMWTYYIIPTTDYYLISSVVMFFGGVVFNTVLFVNFHNKIIEIENGFPIGIVHKLFGWLILAYIILFFFMVFFIDNVIPILYFIIFLTIGGYSRFWILQGYIKAKNNKYKKSENLKHKSWLERILFFNIVLSLLLGYLHRLG